VSGRHFPLFVLALVFLVISGIQVAIATQDVRERHRTLQALQLELDRAAEMYSRLQLELAAVAAYQNVERTAEESLGMSFPAEVERVSDVQRASP
jgi:cell division protein FtsL